MKGPWKALAFLAAVAGTALILSTSAFAFGGATTRPVMPEWRTALGGVAWSGHLAALYPGALNDTELRTVRVTNGTRVKQPLAGVRASIRTADGYVQNGTGVTVVGCLASWFQISVQQGNRSLPSTIPPGDAYTAKIALTMRDAGANQDACRNASPVFIVTATS